MTTIVLDRRAGVIAADSQNTDSAGAITRCRKIERLPDGSFFLGSGHLYTIGKARRWALAGWEEDAAPGWDELMEEGAEEYAFSVLHVRKDGMVILLDDEMCPYFPDDDVLAIGSGAAYALGAMDAGATAEEALRIACLRDPSTSAPIHVEKFRTKRRS